MPNLPFIAAAAALLLIIGNAVVLLRVSDRDKQVKVRLAAIKSLVPVKATGPAIRFNLVQKLGRLLAESPLVGAAEQQKMAGKLAEAGMVGHDSLRIFVATKFGLALGITAAIWILLGALGATPHSMVFRIVAIVGPALAGWRLPDMAIGRVASRRRRKLAEGVPDALDLLVICVEAGLGLEQSLDRVSRDIAIANPVIAAALANTVAEMRVLPQMRDALDNLARGTGLPAIKSVVTTLVQGIQYGTPLSQSLRILSAEMRAKNLIALEERAARLPVLLMIPVILFILPSLFLVIGGPVAIQVIHVLSGR